MLDLETRVDLEEIIISRRGIDEILGRAGRAIIQRGGHPRGSFEEAGRFAPRKPGGGRLFDDLLIAPLRRAVACPERDDHALPVTEELHLDVAGALDEFFQKDSRVAEVCLTRPGNPVECLDQPFCIMADFHADAATARGALEHDGESDGRGGNDRLFRIREQGRALKERDPCLFGDGTGSVLEPEAAQLLGGRSDPGDPAGFAGLGKVGVFRKQSVSRMNAVASSHGRHFKNAGRVQIGGRNGGGTEEKGLVRHADMGRVTVGLGVNGDGGNAEIFQRPDDAAGDLAAIGNEHFGEHVRKKTQSQRKTSTGVGL